MRLSSRRRPNLHRRAASRARAAGRTRTAALAESYVSGGPGGSTASNGDAEDILSRPPRCAWHAKAHRQRFPCASACPEAHEGTSPAISMAGGFHASGRNAFTSRRHRSSLPRPEPWLACTTSIRPISCEECSEKRNKFTKHSVLTHRPISRAHMTGSRDRPGRQAASAL